MGYQGQTYQIQCDRGGLTYAANVDLMQPIEMIPESRNLNLHESGRRKRGGTSTVDDPLAAEIRGIYDFRLKDGTQYIIRACSNGSVYKDDTTAIDDAGMSTTTWFDFETFEDELYIVDGKTIPQKWTGTGSTADVGDLPTDWSGTDQPQWIVKHGRGNSERLWAGGVPSERQRIYASANGDGDDFSDANVTTLNIETGDGFGIVGAMEFGDRLLAFGKSKTWIVDDVDPDTSYWGYDAAQWSGGAASYRLMLQTPNDIVLMMEDGEIYSIRAAESYGDYKSASLTRQSFMHRYIADRIDLSQYEKFHMEYDPVIRAIKIFVVRSGLDHIDTALVYFIDRPPNEAWMVHDNKDFNSGYSASASALVRQSAGVWKTYTGDYNGQTWELEGANKNDDSNGYYAGFKTPPMNFGKPRTRKNFKRGWCIMQPFGNWNLNVKFWIDGTYIGAKTISMAGSGAYLGAFILGTDLLGGPEAWDEVYNLAGNGKRIQFEFYNEDADEDFFVSQILIDFRPLGKEPD